MLPSWVAAPAAAVRPPVLPHELGQAIFTPDGRFRLVRFLTTPLVRDSRNDYIVFDTKAADAEKEHTYAWKIKDENYAVVDDGTESVGAFAWTPCEIGEYLVEATVRVNGAELVVLAMRQNVTVESGRDLAEMSRFSLAARMVVSEGADR